MCGSVSLPVEYLVFEDSQRLQATGELLVCGIDEGEPVFATVPPSISLEHRRGHPTALSPMEDCYCLFARVEKVGRVTVNLIEIRVWEL